MRFIADAQFEARAIELWRRHGLQVGFDEEKLLDDLRLGCLWDAIPELDTLGYLDPEESLVTLNELRRVDLERGNGGLRRFTIGHEIGHWLFHAEPIRSGTIPLSTYGRIWCRDGSTQRHEIQANRFAASLLMPADLVRDRLRDEPWSGAESLTALANMFGVTRSAMRVRLVELGLVFEDDGGVLQVGWRVDPDQVALPW